MSCIRLYTTCIVEWKDKTKNRRSEFSSAQLCQMNTYKARFPLPELTARVDG